MPSIEKCATAWGQIQRIESVSLNGPTLDHSGYETI